jgi:glycosyltransferase involved in cell wall biosynthesis
MAEEKENFSDGAILLPSYMPSPVMVSLGRQLAELGFHIYVVNDGSGAYFNPLFETAKAFATVITLPKNSGKGTALKAGFAELFKDETLRYVLTVDSDGQHSIEDILSVARLAKEKHATVLAERIFKGEVPFRSRLGNDLSKFSQTLISGRFLKDNQCGLRAFALPEDRWILHVSGKHYEYEMNVIDHLILADSVFYLVPIKAIYEKGNTTSHFKPLHDTFRIQRVIILDGGASLLGLLFSYILSAIFLQYCLPWFLNSPYLALTVGLSGGYLSAAFFKTFYWHPRRMFFYFLEVGLAYTMIFLFSFLAYFLLGELCHWNMFLVLFLGILASILPMYGLLRFASLKADQRERR